MKKFSILHSVHTTWQIYVPVLTFQHRVLIGPLQVIIKPCFHLWYKHKQHIQTLLLALWALDPIVRTKGSNQQQGTEPTYDIWAHTCITNDNYRLKLLVCMTLLVLPGWWNLRLESARSKASIQTTRIHYLKN